MGMADFAYVPVLPKFMAIDTDGPADSGYVPCDNVLDNAKDIRHFVQIRVRTKFLQSSIGFVQVFFSRKEYDISCKTFSVRWPQVGRSNFWALLCLRYHFVGSYVRKIPLSSENLERFVDDTAVPRSFSDAARPVFRPYLAWCFHFLL